MQTLTCHPKIALKKKKKKIKLIQFQQSILNNQQNLQKQSAIFTKEIENPVPKLCYLLLLITTTTYYKPKLISRTCPHTIDPTICTINFRSIYSCIPGLSPLLNPTNNSHTLLTSFPFSLSLLNQSIKVSLKQFFPLRVAVQNNWFLYCSTVNEEYQ